MDEEKFWLHIGQQVRHFRKLQGLSQEKVAEAIGYGRTSIVNLEAGRQQMPTYVLYYIAYVLDVPFENLFPDSE